MAAENTLDLIERFVEDSLDEHGIEELRAIVRADEAARQELVRALRMSGMIETLDVGKDTFAALHQAIQQRLHASRVPRDFSKRVARNIARTGPRRSRTAHPAAHRRRYTGWLSIAACLAIIVGSLVYKHYQSEWFVDAVIAHVKETMPGVKIVRNGERMIAIVNMELYARDRIETSRDENVTFIYKGEATQVKVHETTTLDIGDVGKGKRLHLERGVIDARADPQPRGKPMVITTANAKAEVRGTSLSLAVTRRRTRLDVFEGLAQLTRLADRKSVDVATGQYAVVAEGVELVAMAIGGQTAVDEPPVNIEQPALVEGKVLFGSDFTNPSDDWEIVRGTPKGGFEAVAGNPNQRLKYGKSALQNPPEASCLSFEFLSKDAPPPNNYMGIRSKRAITAERFVVEAHMRWTAGGAPYKWGIEQIGPVRTVGTLMKSTYPSMPRTHRWEFIPAADAPGEGVLLGRWTMTSAKGKKAEAEQSFHISSSRKILIAIAGAKGPMKRAGFEIFRITVREIQ